MITFSRFGAIPAGRRYSYSDPDVHTTQFFVAWLSHKHIRELRTDFLGELHVGKERRNVCLSSQGDEIVGLYSTRRERQATWI